MKENSIERDIHLLESYAGMTHKMNDNQGRPKLDQAIERVLLDYKRVLKENEQLRTEVNSLKKENEELNKANEELKKRIQSLENGTFLGNYDGLVKLQNELDKLQKKYETDTHILQNQLDLANADRIDLAQQNKELRKENEELHKEIERMKSLDIYKLVEDWETSQLIPIQKVKDKIEEIVEKIKHEENEKVVIYLSKQKNILQELLESEE